jgi:hypothetical protein
MAGLLARKETQHFEILAGLSNTLTSITNDLSIRQHRLRRRYPTVKNEDPRLRDYQLDLVTPGINPWEAHSRKAIRDRRKRRLKLRRRPLCSQRLTKRVGLASRGSWASPS